MDKFNEAEKEFLLDLLAFFKRHDITLVRNWGSPDFFLTGEGITIDALWLPYCIGHLYRDEHGNEKVIPSSLEEEE